MKIFLYGEGYGANFKLMMMYTKMCFISSAETSILLQIYDELKSTEPETAGVLEYLMSKSGIIYK